MYYESIGLLKPPARSAGNYRRYGERDLQRLQQICAYRHAGLTLDDIRAIITQPDRRESDAAAVLKRRLVALDAEIETRRAHQRAILQAAQKRFDREKKNDHKREVGFYNESLGDDRRKLCTAGTRSSKRPRRRSIRNFSNSCIFRRPEIRAPDIAPWSDERISTRGTRQRIT